MSHRRDAPFLEPVLVFLGAAVLGIISRAPSVTFGDAGEFTACAATLGLAHAPSYPLAALMGRLLAILAPWGNWALRTNLLSALASAGALAVLGSALRRAGAGLAGRLAAVLWLGLAPLWRYESAVTEVFALQGLVLACVLWVLFSFSDRLFAPRPMAALGLLAGLGMANHHTLLLAGPACAWEVLRSWRVKGGRRLDFAQGIGYFLVFCAMGLSAYLFLPLRSRVGPPLDWGHPVDLPRFLWVFLRKDYGSLSLTVEGQSAFSLAAIWAQSVRYLRACWDGLGPSGLSLAALGLAAWPGRSSSRFGLLGWVFFTGPFFLMLGNPPFDSQTSAALERFYLASWLGLAVLICAGVDAVEERLKHSSWALLLVPVAGAWISHGQWWLRRDFAAYDYGRSVLKSLPPGATLFMDGGDDTFYTTAFLAFAERRRTDAALFDRGGLVFKSAYGPDFRRLARPAKQTRRQEVETVMAARGNLFYSTLNGALLPGFVLRPWGLLRRADANATQAAEIDPWDFYPFRWQESLLESQYRDRALVCFYPVMRSAARVAQHRLQDALRELETAWAMGRDVLWLRPHVAHDAQWLGYEASLRQDWLLAREALLLSLQADPRSSEARSSLGVAYERAGRAPEARQCYEEAIRLDPGSDKAYYNLGVLHWSGSRWAEAAEAFTAAARIDPRNAAAARYAVQARRRAGGQ